MERIRLALEQLGERPSFSDFKETMAPLFLELLTSPTLEAFILDALERLASLSEDKALPSYVLLSSKCGRSGLSVVNESLEPDIMGSTRHELYGVIAGSATFERYRLSKCADVSVLDSDARLVADPPMTLTPKCQYVSAEAWVDVLDIHGEGILLRLESAPIYPVCWFYERRTKSAKGLISARALDSKIQESLKILSQIGSKRDADICIELSRHSSHWVRWEAIRTVNALGHEMAADLLQQALNDPHPEVREAARAAFES